MYQNLEKYPISWLIRMISIVLISLTFFSKSIYFVDSCYYYNSCENETELCNIFKIILILQEKCG